MSGELKKGILSPNPVERATITLSFKFSASRSTNKDSIYAVLPSFLNSLKDKEISVREKALISLNSIVHHLPSILRNEINDILPIILYETILKKELIREVDLGAFKQEYDDGAPLRRGAYILIETLVANIPEKLDMNAIIERVLAGLGKISSI